MDPIKKKAILRGNLTTKFGERTRDENFHAGIDVANKEGTPVPALKDGIVTATGPKMNGQGNVVVLKDVDGNTHEYSHLKGFLVRPGQKVKKGENLAPMGSSGNSYSLSGGDPTHVDIRIATAYGKAVNPMTYLQNLNKNNGPQRNS